MIAGVDLVRNLEHSHRFLSPRLARETAESNQNGAAHRTGKRRHQREL